MDIKNQFVQNDNQSKENQGSLQQQPSATTSHLLAQGLLQIYQPPLMKVKNDLKELIGKQNKIYINLSAEKFKFDNSDIPEIMAKMKLYKDKLIKLKKQMQNIHEKTKSLKKRSAHIQACKEKELARKISKQQQEETLIKKI